MGWWRTERRGTYGLAAVLVALLGFFPFVRGTRVPILGWVDLAIHEAGHLLFIWAPHDVTLVMGNGFQALVPLTFAGAFAIRHRDLAGAAVALAWCASALHDASVYIADAPYRALPLLGPEDSHDWWQLLGSRGALDVADDLSRAVLVLAALVFVLAVAFLTAGIRWDLEWQAGDAGALYWPWTRADARLRGPVPDAPPTAAEDDGDDDAGQGDPPSRGRVVW